MTECEHNHRKSDEPAGTKHVVRWKCVQCGAIVYNDADLFRLRLQVASLEVEIDHLAVAMRKIHEIATDELED